MLPISEPIATTHKWTEVLAEDRGQVTPDPLLHQLLRSTIGKHRSLLFKVTIPTACMLQLPP